MTYSKYQSKVVPLENNWRLNCLLPTLATITNPKGERHTTYFGFNNYQEAQVFYQYLTQNRLCSRAIIRRSQRLSSCIYEIKAWGVGSNLLVRILNQQDLPLSDFINQEVQVSVAPN
ncbi:hypothetical protein [Crocosphaera watsonii]|uniref:hypothetical protein n=1 Tax=Crocosphaera watsonii TaxID=263511 RepID=UPI000908115C|nr:hypothetical protein [Crocosphaera watsonii]